MIAIRYPNHPALVESSEAAYSVITPSAEARFPMETPLRSLAVTPTNSATTPTISQISRTQVVRALEIIQDFIVVSLCLGLFV